MREQLWFILLMNGGVLIVPGLNFAILTRYALQSGLRAAIYCTAGITLAIAVHVMCAILGSWQIIKNHSVLFNLIQFLGACYIAFMASRMLFNSFKSKIEMSLNTKADGNPFFNGFIVDLLNPFVTIFYFSLFAQIMKDEVTYSQMLIDWLFILLITFVWFLLVSTGFSREAIRTRFLQYGRWVERISSIILFYFSYQLISAS